MRASPRLLNAFAARSFPSSVPPPSLACHTARRAINHTSPLTRSHLQPSLSASQRLRQARYSSNASSSSPSASSAAPGSTFNSNTSTPETPHPDENAPKQTAQSFKIPQQLEGVPHYRMSFTCKPCGTRSTHRVSKHGYHHGTVLIGCPGCKARHLISDHLHIFSEKKVTLEDILRQKSQDVRKGIVSPAESEKENEEDIEIWDQNAPSEEEQAEQANQLSQPKQ